MPHSITALASAATLGAAGLAGQALAVIPPNTGDLFITEEGSGNVYHHNGVNGAYIQTFTSLGVGRSAMAIHTGGPNGNILVGAVTGGVSEFDRNTGAFIKTYNGGGGWQWAGVWRANGNVLIGDMSTNDIRQYNGITGAFMNVFSPVPGAADMTYGLNGNLYVCSYMNGGVFEVNPANGAILGVWAPTLQRPNDIAFLPDGRRIVTSMSDNLAHVYDASWNPLTTFQGAGWQRPHGIDISPNDGNIYVVDGVTQQVHVFDPTTYTELNSNFLSTATKPVDIEFRRAIPAPASLGLFGAAGLLRRRRR
jgi:DNA-binding beta-propeller fold protein YncE